MLYFLISVALLIVLFWIPESPKFLINKMDKAKEKKKGWFGIFMRYVLRILYFTINWKNSYCTIFLI